MWTRHLSNLNLFCPPPNFLISGTQEAEKNPTEKYFVASRLLRGATQGGCAVAREGREATGRGPLSGYDQGDTLSEECSIQLEILY